MAKKGGGGGLRVGDLFVAFTASSAGFSKSLTTIVDDVAKTSAKVEAAANKIGGFGMLIGGAMGAAVAVAAKNNAELAAEVEKVKGAFNGAANELGTMMLPVVKAVSEAVEELAGRLRGLSPEAKENIAQFVEIAAVSGVAAVALGKVAGAVNGLAQTFRLIIPLVTGFLLPVAALAVALGAIALAAGAVYKAFEGKWESIGEAISTAFQGALDTVRNAASGIMEALGKAARFLISTFRGVLEMMESLAVFDWQKKLLDKGKGAANAAEGMFSADGIRDAVRYGKDLGAAVVDGFKDSAGGAMDLAKALGLDKIEEKLRGLMPQYQAEDPAAEVNLPRIQLQLAAPVVAMAREVIEITGRTFKSIETGVGDVLAGLGQRAMKSFGRIGDVVSDAMEGGKAGVMGAIVAVVGNLLMDSIQFQELVQRVNGIVQMAANAVGMVIDGAAPLIDVILSLAETMMVDLGPVFDMLGMVLAAVTPIIQWVANIVGAVFRPAMEFLFEVFKVVALIVMGIVLGIGEAWNFILGIVEGIVRLFDGGAADSIASLKFPADATRKAMEDLSNATYANSRAKSEERIATEKTTRAINNIGESLSNVPTGFKVGSLRLGATAVGPIPSAGSGGGTTVVNNGDTTIIVQPSPTAPPAAIAEIVLERMRAAETRKSGRPPIIGQPRFMAP